MGVPKPIDRDPEMEREEIAGPDKPAKPYPVYLSGWVNPGFQRGSKDLGCPTANLPDEAVEPYYEILGTGVYYGYAKVFNGEDEQVHKMVMSIGYNPYYHNLTKTAEVHVMHKFDKDFYGKEIRTVILGYIRPEYNYKSMDDLIKDIQFDIDVSNNSLERPAYQSFKQDPFWTSPSQLTPPTNDLSTPRIKPQ